MTTSTNPEKSVGNCATPRYLVQGQDQSRPVVAIGYARCSTEEQSLESMAIEYQVKRLEEICGTGNVIRDETSATKCLLHKRTKFWDAIERLRSLPAGVERRLIYTRIDRLARNIADAETINDLCREGIIFQGLDSGEILQGAQGTMMLNLGLMFAQFEQQQLGEKIEAKYRDRRKSKSPMNRPPFGYKLNKIVSTSGVKFRFVPKEPQFTQAKQIYAAVIESGGSLKETLRLCPFEGMPRSPRGLKMWLGNITNLGHTKYEGRQTRSGKVIPGEVVENTHTPVVDQDTFNRVQLLLGERSFKSFRRTARDPYPLQGVVRCPDCGFILSFTGRTYKAKGNNIGRYAGQFKAGEVRHSYSACCRYRGINRCHVDLSDGCLSVNVLNGLKSQAWQYLMDRADELTQATSIQENSLSPEEVEVMAGIKALQAIPGSTMKPQIEALKKQLEQLKFEREGKAAVSDTKVAEVQQLNLSVRAFEQLSYAKQNQLLKQFFIRIVPPYKGQPAIFDSVF